MSVGKLISQSGLVKATAGISFNDTKIVPILPSKRWIQTYSATPASVSLATGTSTQWVFQPASNDFSQIDDIVMQFYATNSDAVNTPSFYMPYMLLASVKCKVNGVTVCWYQENASIKCRVDDYLRDFGEKRIYTEIQRLMNSSQASGVAVDTIPNGSNTQIRLSMVKVLFPFLEKVILNNGIYKVEFEVVFQANTSSVNNNLFTFSNTVNNAYGSNLSFNNIQFAVNYVQHNDARMLVQAVPPLMLTDYYLPLVVPNVSWTNVSSGPNVGDTYTVNLANQFTRISKYVDSVSMFIYDNANNTTFNSAVASQYSSGGKFINYLVKSRSNILIDFSNATTQLNQRKTYDADIWKNRSAKGEDMPLELMNNSSLLSKTWTAPTRIDLSNIVEDDWSQSDSISGIDTLSNDVEITFGCGSSISANCTLFIVLHYMQVYTSDAKGNIKQL